MALWLHTRQVLLPGLLLLLILEGCASRPPLLSVIPTDSDLPATVELSDVPFFPQRAYQCGPAALATALSFEGFEINPDGLVGEVYIPKRKGSLQIDMVSSVRRRGLLPYEIEPGLSALMSELSAGNPVLVLQDLGIPLKSVWHYAVVIGFNRDEDVLILRSGHTARKRVSAREFDRTWRASGRWGLVLLEPGEMPAVASESRFLSAAAALESSLSPEKRIKLYAAAHSQWPGNEIAMFGLSSAYYDHQEYTKAEAWLRKIIEKNPSNGAALNNLAFLLSEQGCREAAIDVLNRAQQTDQGRWSQTLSETRRQVEGRENSSSECALKGL